MDGGRHTVNCMLWNPKPEVGGVRVTKKDDCKSPSAYHFHDFLMSGEEIRFKYSTFGHADEKAYEKSLRHISARDLPNAGCLCALSNHTKESESSFESILGTSRSIYYLNEEVLHARHSVWQDIVKRTKKSMVKLTMYEYVAYHS